MKKLFIIAAAALALAACNSSSDQEKALLDDVIKAHDKVMGKDEQLMKNKMKIDTLLTTVKDTAQKNQLIKLNAGLIVSEQAMENWMQRFDPEQKDKSHDEKVAYLTGQKRQVTVIDSQINVAIQKSTEYLNQLKK
ncbi:MAG: hypothetical protein ABI367_15570 [Mucilaginibacter sp.]